MNEELDPTQRFGNPNDIRSVLLRAWDSDCGNFTLNEALWHFLLAAIELELNRKNITHPGRIEPIQRAVQRIWENRGKTYEKALWRDLTDALDNAFGPFWKYED